jgi:hypothetical protein
MRERLSLEQLAGPARYFAGISGFGILRPHIMPDSLLQLTLCDRGELPFEELTSILARESVRPRAIFQTTQMVRTATGECVPSSDCFYRRNEYSRIWQAFYRGNDPTDKVVLDPFVGGGI